MALHPLAGKPAPLEYRVNIPRLIASYYLDKPDAGQSAQRVAFGTSGHRGVSLQRSFNEDHILAIAQALCDYRRHRGIAGPLYLGMDTHALSEVAYISAVEVFAANGVTLILQTGRTSTPTPVISHAILTHNRGRRSGFADGVVITPSHNPPSDGGLKYNPPHGGPADSAITDEIESRANAILEEEPGAVKRLPFSRAMQCDCICERDLVMPYVEALQDVLDMEAISASGLRLGVDPMGGASVGYWTPIAETWGLNLEVVNREIDPAFAFMTLDYDGKIRMDCSSPHAMARLVSLKDRFDIAFGSDPDADRHGIVCPSVGLMNPNHYLSVAVWYLFQNRPGWRSDAAIGKTLVSSSMIDRVAAALGRRLAEVPVGFKWFVDGLSDGSYGFGGEESAGASFLRKDGTVWSTDKDGMIMSLLAAEITARTGKDPGLLYQQLERDFGHALYERIDVAATAPQRAAMARLSPESIRTDHLAGEPIAAIITRAPANDAAIGGLKVTTKNGWFAARPSGTEDIYKIYAESFRDHAHLHQIQEEAKALVMAVLP